MLTLEAARLAPTRDIAPAAIRVLSGYRWRFVLIGIFFALDGLWARAVGLSITGLPDTLGAALVLFATGLSWQIAGAVCTERPNLVRAGFVIGRLGTGTASFAVWSISAGLIAIFSYLCAHLALPLLDDEVARLDRLLGFDWLGWYRFVKDHAWLDAVLGFSYRSQTAQIALGFLLTAFLTDRTRTAELYWTSVSAAIIACAISGVLPLMGGRPHYGIHAGWVHDLTLLRTDGPLTFAIKSMTGIVSLPSYHAALAVIFVRVVRGTGPLFFVSLALNTSMLVSTLTDGGHYLVDVIAGVIMAAGVIAAVDLMLRRSDRFQRDPLAIG